MYLSAQKEGKRRGRPVCLPAAAALQANAAKCRPKDCAGHWGGLCGNQHA
jgi:hypothetical protein